MFIQFSLLLSRPGKSWNFYGIGGGGDAPYFSLVCCPLSVKLLQKGPFGADYWSRKGGGVAAGGLGTMDCHYMQTKNANFVTNALRGDLSTDNVRN